MFMYISLFSKHFVHYYISKLRSICGTTVFLKKTPAIYVYPMSGDFISIPATDTKNTQTPNNNL